ncbi:hypothetical protein TTRE_0000022301 [Trichuris trichiura]|uniref:Uncharacterized protein n=1 Tax=Trichuris trichiura TaxID=36087 RepID=A0A077YW20_TRITR|nr:hypothetical protein TTRE_0000022301 [Trichuris trichiura]
MDIVDSVSVGDVLLCSVKEEGEDEDDMPERTARPLSLPSSLADEEVNVSLVPPPPAQTAAASVEAQCSQQDPLSSSSLDDLTSTDSKPSAQPASPSSAMAPDRDDSGKEMPKSSSPMKAAAAAVPSLEAPRQPASEHLVSGFLIVGFRHLEEMQDWIIKHEANRQAVAEACNAKRMEINCVRLKKEKASKKAHRVKKNASSKERDKAAMDVGGEMTPMPVDADGLRKSAEIGRLDGLPPLERLVKEEKDIEPSSAVDASTDANTAKRSSSSPASRGDYDHWSSASSSGRAEHSANVGGNGTKMSSKREASDQQGRPAKSARLDLSSSPKAQPSIVDCKASLSPIASRRTPKSMLNATTSSSSTEWGKAGGAVRVESGLSSSGGGPTAYVAKTTTATAAAAANDLEQRLFLASKGSTATPAYFHTEMHQHQHTHMHQYPFLPPFFAPNIGFPAYAALPGFAYPPPAAAAAANGLNVPLAGKRKGKWCAKHVEIAWLIYRKVRQGTRKGETLVDAESQHQRLASDGSKVAVGVVESQQEEKRLGGSPARPSFHDRVTPVVLNGIGDKESLPRFLIDPALGVAQEELATKRRELQEQLLPSSIPPPPAPPPPPPAVPFTGAAGTAGQDGSLASGLLTPSLRPPMLPFMLGGAEAAAAAAALPTLAQSLNDRLLSQSVIQPPTSPWALPGAIAGGIPLMPTMGRSMQDHLRDGGPLAAGLQFGPPVPPTGASLDLLRPFSLDPNYLARLQPPVADGGMFRTAGLDSVLLERNEQLLRFQEQMAAAAAVASNMGIDGGLASSATSSTSAGQQQQQLASVLELERTMNGGRGAAIPQVAAPFDPALISNLLHAERIDMENRNRLLATRGALQDAMTIGGATDTFRLAMLGGGGVVPTPTGLTEPFGRTFGQAALTNHLLQSASVGGGAAGGAPMLGLSPSLVAGAPKFPHSFSSTLEQLARQKREAMRGCRLQAALLASLAQQLRVGGV